MRNRALVLMALVLSSAYGYVTAYHVEPVKASWSGWTTLQNNYVSEVITCNFDEPVYAEYFTGTATGQQYQVQLQIPGSPPVVVAEGNAYENRSHVWVRCSLDVLRPDLVTKGKRYEVRWTLSGGTDSLMYYYDSTDCYKYGGMAVGDAVPFPNPFDLVCRVYGRMNAVDSGWWGMVPWFPPTDSTDSNRLAVRRQQWLDAEQDAPIGIAHVGIYWDSVQKVRSDSYDFAELDREVMYLHDSAGIEIHARLFGSPQWASSRPNDTSDTGYRYSAPRNLWPAEDSVNFWARWLDVLVDSFGDKIHTWEIWNEPNDNDTTSHANTGWWQPPNRQYPDDLDARGLCSLYVRLCWVAESIINQVHDRQDRIVVGGFHRVHETDTDPDPDLLPGAEWLWMCYDIARLRYGGAFWHTASIHAYQDAGPISPGDLEVDAETLRAIMRAHGREGDELWNTEMGWGIGSGESLVQAHNVGESFVLTKASEALPQGGFDRMLWHHYRGWGVGDGLGLMTHEMQRRPAFYAYAQTESALTGKRFNGRVMAGDTRDDSVRMYEFEDTTTLKRTWVCWTNGGEGQGAVNVSLPATTDTLSGDDLNYNDQQYLHVMPAEVSGWLPTTLDERPVFISEGGTVKRPDLVVDSIMVPVGAQVRSVMDVDAFVKNLGNDTTPDTVALDFLCDTTVFAHGTSSWPMAPGDSCDISLEINPIPEWMGGRHLFWARVNPGQTYVEKVSMDDNSGYVRRWIRCPPDGRVDIITPPVCKAGAPILPLRLTSVSWESDSTGQTPADSARVLFAWFGQRDTVVHAADTTAWFPFCTDTVLRFPRGCGVYRVYAQFRDSGANDSPFYPDSTDSIIVFDSVPATGSIVINAGARFAPSATCTLQVAVTDSGSGLRAVRLGTRLSNFVSNSGCVASDGVWGFSGSGTGYDTALAMARLTVGQSGTSTLYQNVPPESLESHWGDSLHLVADALVALPGAEAVSAGCVRFGYRFTHDDPAQETLTVVAGIPFSGGIACHAGTSSLDTSFAITQPPPDTFWQFAGGYVEASVSGSGTEGGEVWLDNVRLEVSGPYPEASWWSPCSTTALWSLDTSCGWQKLYGMFQDSAGTETSVPLVDSIILDCRAPVVHIGCPEPGAIVNGVVNLTGYAFDEPIPGLDTFFEWRRLEYRHQDSADWLPCDPDSVSYSAAWSDSGLTEDVPLGDWNTAGLENGSLYCLKLSAKDSAGNVSEHELWVIVNNDMGDNSCSGPPGGGSGLGEGSIYVGSSTGYLLHLSDDLDSLGCISISDSGSQAYVTAILETSDDSLLVLDARNRRIHKLSSTGENRRGLVSNLSIPTGVAKDDNGNLWLVDKGVHRIGKFRRDGTLVFTRGGPGRDSTNLNSPEAIAVKSSLVYVADSRNDRIAVWDTSGDYQGSVNGDFANPTAVVVTDSGSIYVTDGADGKLKGITPRGGKFLTIAEAHGSRLKGLVASENRHSLFTLAPQTNTIHKYRVVSDDSLPGGVQSGGKVNLPKKLSLAQPFPNPARTRLSISYALPRQTRVVVKLYDVAGKLVSTMVNGEQKPGYYHVTWNRQDAKGRSVACGVYFCTLSAEKQRFSRKVVLTE